MVKKPKTDLGFFISAIAFVAKLAIAVHSVLMIFNFFMGIGILSIYNLVSVLILIGLLLWLKRDGHHNLIFGIILFKILFDSIFATFLLGEDSAALYFIIVLPIIFLVHPKWNIQKVILFFCFLLIIFFTSYFTLYNAKPILKEASEHNQILQVFNIALICLSGYSILLFIKHTTIQNQKSLLAVNRELEERNKLIKKQSRRLELLLREMHHRVKNNLQLISSMINLQKNKLHDHKSIGILEDSQNRIHAISLIHQKLFQQEEVAAVNMNLYLQDLVHHLQWLNNKVKCSIHAIDLPLTLDKAVPLGLITSELLNNSFKHAFSEEEDGNIKIELKMIDDNIVQLMVLDSGRGYKQDFDPSRSDGLGMEIILTLSDQIGARTRFVSDKDGALSIVEFEDDGLHISG